MPTEAKQAQVAELVEVLSKRGHRDRLRPSRAVGGRPAQGPPPAARAGHRVQGHQEPAGAHRRRAGGAHRARPCSWSAERARDRWGSEETALAKGLLDALRPYRGSRCAAPPSAARTYDAAAVMRLATAAARETLLAQLAGGMASPLATMAGLLAAPLRNLGYGLMQLRDQPRSCRRPDDRPVPHPSTTTHTPTKEGTTSHGHRSPPTRSSRRSTA